MILVRSLVLAMLATTASAADKDARLIITHHDGLHAKYEVAAIAYTLDGAEIFSEKNPAEVRGDLRQLAVGSHDIEPGTHELQVEFVLRSSAPGGSRGLAYYQFKMKAKYVLDLDSGHSTTVQVKAMPPEAGTKDQPSVRYKVHTTRL